MTIPVEPIGRWHHCFAQKFRSEADGSIVVMGKRWILALLVFIGLLAVNFPIVEASKHTWFSHYAENDVPIAALLLAVVTILVPPKRELRFSARNRRLEIVDSLYLFLRRTTVVPFSEMRQLLLVSPPPDRLAPLTRPVLVLMRDNGPLYLVSLGEFLMQSAFLGDVVSLVGLPAATTRETT